jgi:hypothetical protein
MIRKKEFRMHLRMHQPKRQIDPQLFNLLGFWQGMVPMLLDGPFHI